MDLLPHPKLGSGGVEPFEVPCVADTPYSGTDFWDFPQTHGFGDRWITLPATRLAALAQSWLFFGTISEFLGRQIDYHEFKAFRQGFAFDDRGHSEGSTVTLKPLISLLDEWLRLRRQRSGAGGPKSASSLRSRFHSILPGGGSRLDDSINDPGHDSDLYQLASFLDKVFDLAEDFEQLSQGHIFPIPAIILSVKVLCITLSGLCEQVRVETGKPAPMSWPRTSSRRPGANPLISSLPSSQILLDMFQQHGWCPFRVGKITSTHNYAVAYYLTRIYRRFSPERSHRGCSETECVASNITDFNAYQPSHSEPSCRCRNLSVHTDQLRNIILAGGIPLVRVIVSPRRKISIKVVKMEPWKTPFVAFSHVWEDTGLGNPRANALPKCQLTRLQDWAETSGLANQGCEQLGGVERKMQHQRRYFWIDSLCIPAGPPTDEARIQAVNKIPPIFQAAERVIVLDQALLKLSVELTEPCELAGRLSVSPWSSRCWTYLEASLNLECLEVRCADGSFDPLWNGHKQLQSAQKHSKFDGAAALFGKWVLKESSASKPLLDRALRVVDDDGKIQVIRALIGNSLLRSVTKELQYFQIRAVKRRIAGDLKIENPDLCTTFVHAWEELSKRSNTLTEDQHIILATLLGFNTQPIQRLSNPEDRMAAILGNMDGIPLSLFLSSPRSHRGTTQGPSGNHVWYPLFPSSNTRLPTMASSQYTNIRSDIATGDLYFPNNRISRREVSTLIIPPQAGSRMSGKPVQFRVQDPSDKWGGTCIIKSDHSIELEASSDESDAYCLLMRRNSQASSSAGGKGEKRNGALFRIKKISTPGSEPVSETVGMAYTGGRSSSSIWKSSSSLWLSAGMPTPAGAQVAFSKEGITTNGSDFGPIDVGLLLNHQNEHHGPPMVVPVVYECPVTVTPVVEAQVDDVPFDFGFNVTQDHSDHQGKSEDCQVLKTTPFPSSWQLVLERDGPPPPLLTSHIPSYIESTSTPPISTTFLLTALDGLVAAGSVSMSLAICFTLLPLHILSPLSSISVVVKLTLHAVSIIQLLLFDDDIDNFDQQKHGFSFGFSRPLGKSSIYDILHLITVAIYTISRAISAGNGGKLNILDRVFISWSFLGHTVNILARVLVTRYYVIPHLWNQYLASFDDGQMQNSQGKRPAHSEEEHTNMLDGRRRNIPSPPSDMVIDNDLAAESFLVPPWDSHPRPLSRQQTSYARFSNHRHQDFQWESPYDNEPIGTYPSPMEVYHPDIHSPITPGRNGNTQNKSQRLWGIVLPIWSKVSGLISLPPIMTTAGNSRRVLNPPTEAGKDKETTRLFNRGRNGATKKQNRRRRRPRTDSMVVEAPDTEAGSEFYNYDRTSWRSGDHLLGEARSGR